MTETATTLDIGQRVPAFELADEEGRPFNLIQQLEEGPLVLIFYRGDWWSYCNGQLVSYARKYEEFEKLGMRIAGVSVDPPENNKAMVEKLILPFPLLSDPQGDLAKRCGLWNAEEGVAVPTIAVLDRGGIVRYLYVGEDFADRPGDAAVFEALDGVEAGAYEGAYKEAEIRVTAEEAATSSVHPDKRPMSLEQLVSYYRGVFFATVALKRRFAAWGSEGRRAFGEVGAYQRLVREYADRIKETVELKQSS